MENKGNNKVNQKAILDLVKGDPVCKMTKSMLINKMEDFKQAIIKTHFTLSDFVWILWLLVPIFTTEFKAIWFLSVRDVKISVYIISWIMFLFFIRSLFYRFCNIFSGKYEADASKRVEWIFDKKF